MIYTTNAIESYHRQIRKVTKNKGAFPSDMALIKLIFLAAKNIQNKWNCSTQNYVPRQYSNLYLNNPISYG
ncbi:MAG: transposase [Sphingobacteriales bacterium]|nr:transposase [Sphingobacteriales bacterium]